jgi:hypothetical protein
MGSAMSDDDMMPENPDSGDDSGDAYTPSLPVRRETRETRAVDRSSPVRRLDIPPEHYGIAQGIYQALHEEQESSSNELQDRLMAAIKEQDNVIKDQVRVLYKLSLTVRDLKKNSGIASKVVWSAMAGSIALAAYVADKIWTSSEEQTTTRMELQYHARAIDKLEHDLERDRDRPDRQDSSVRGKGTP